MGCSICGRAGRLSVEEIRDLQSYGNGMIVSLQADVERLTKERDGLRGLVVEARDAILSRDCVHELVCGNAACREAGHEHESYGDAGWSCGEECECLPACEGYGATTCEPTTRKRDLVGRLEDAIGEGEEYEALLSPAPVVSIPWLGYRVVGDQVIPQPAPEVKP